MFSYSNPKSNIFLKKRKQQTKLFEGRLAQLVERTLSMREVRRSKLLSSIKNKTKQNKNILRSCSSVG